MIVSVLNQPQFVNRRQRIQFVFLKQAEELLLLTSKASSSPKEIRWLTKLRISTALAGHIEIIPLVAECRAQPVAHRAVKVPPRRSSQSFGCLTIGFVVSGTDVTAEYLARGPQMLLWTSKTVSMSPVKCTRPSVCIRGRQSHDPIFGEGGGGGGGQL